MTNSVPRHTIGMRLDFESTVVLFGRVPGRGGPTSIQIEKMGLPHLPRRVTHLQKGFRACSSRKLFVYSRDRLLHPTCNGVGTRGDSQAFPASPYALTGKRAELYPKFVEYPPFH